MAMDIGTLVAKIKVDDGDFDRKADSWSAKGTAIGSTFGNVAADAIGQVASMLSDFVNDAVAASDATDKFKQTLKFGGLSTAKIDALTQSTQAYADTTTYSLGDIQSITATLAANGVKDYDTLAMSLGNLNAAAGGSSETFGRVGSVLTQTAGQGKLTTENWNQLTDAIPGASGRLMDALLQAGAYTGNFREAMERGEITADEFNAAITQIGTEPIAVEAAKSTETFEGSAGNLAATIQGKLVAALALVKQPINDVTNFLADLIANSNVFIPIVAGLGAVILAALAPAIWAAVVATAAWTVALLANPITWIVLAIGALVAGIVWLVMNWDTAVAWITEVWGGFLSWVTGVVDGFVSWWNGMWAGFASWIGEVWSGFTSWITQVWQGFIDWVVGVVEGFVGWWNGIWAAVGKFFSDAWNNLVNWVRAIWTGWMAWIQAIVTGFVSYWRNSWNQVGAFINQVWQGFASTVTGIWNGFVGFIRGALNGFVTYWIGLWNTTKNGAIEIWNGTINWFRGIPGMIMGVFSAAGQWLYNTGRDIINGLWNGLRAVAGNIVSWFQNTFGGIIDTVRGLFGIASPSRVFREFGIYIGEGLVDGLEKMEDPIDAEFRRITSVPPIDVPPPPSDDPRGGPGYFGAPFHYHAAENQSLSSEEALFDALSSPRAGGNR